jgi:Fic family protein
MMPVQYHYDKFPPTDINWENLIELIGPASAALARYDGTLSAIPNPNVLLTPLTTQEAVLSSRIEGTQATMGEVLEFEAEGDSKDISVERRADIHEVLNYRRAMWHAIAMLEKLPFCQRVLRETHSVLLEGVRGNGRFVGEYRKVPNWIGPPGCTIENARFVPISADRLSEAIDTWERYSNENAPDRLVQLSIVHAEFEAIHPFLDGNGRLGRMIVPLYMYSVGLIQSPMFYISAFFERNRDEYYERLLSISRDNDWTSWCKFFLQGVIEQAQENQKKAIQILELYEAKKSQIVEMTRSQYAIHALDFIFSRPIFKSTSFIGSQEIPAPTAKRIITLLRDNGILITLREARGRRPAFYVFPELLNTAEGKDVF